MRMLMKVEFCTQTANNAVKAGTLGKLIQGILDEQKPEAAYFTEFEGKRTGIIIIEVRDASDIPGIAEPWFLALNARLELHPVMTPKDLRKAGPGIKRAAAKYS